MVVLAFESYWCNSYTSKCFAPCGTRSPKLKFWMGQLELEYHDLLSLFEIFGCKMLQTFEKFWDKVHILLTLGLVFFRKVRFEVWNKIWGFLIMAMVKSLWSLLTAHLDFAARQKPSTCGAWRQSWRRCGVALSLSSLEFGHVWRLHKGVDRAIFPILTAPHAARSFLRRSSIFFSLRGQGVLWQACRLSSTSLLLGTLDAPRSWVCWTFQMFLLLWIGLLRACMDVFGAVEATRLWGRCLEDFLATWSSPDCHYKRAGDNGHVSLFWLWKPLHLHCKVSASCVAHFDVGHHDDHVDARSCILWVKGCPSFLITTTLLVLACCTTRVTRVFVSICLVWLTPLRFDWVRVATPIKWSKAFEWWMKKTDFGSRYWRWIKRWLWMGKHAHWRHRTGWIPWTVNTWIGNFTFIILQEHHHFHVFVLWWCLLLVPWCSGAFFNLVPSPLMLCFDFARYRWLLFTVLPLVAPKTSSHDLLLFGPCFFWCFLVVAAKWSYDLYAVEQSWLVLCSFRPCAIQKKRILEPQMRNAHGSWLRLVRRGLDKPSGCCRSSNQSLKAPSIRNHAVPVFFRNPARLQRVSDCLSSEQLMAFSFKQRFI